MASDYRLILKDPKATKKTLIYVTIHVNNTRFKFSTSENIEPSRWNPLKQEVKKGEYSDEINERLRIKGTALYEAVKRLEKEEQEITKEAIEERMNAILFPKKVIKEEEPVVIIPTFVEFVEQLVAEGRNGTRLHEGRKLSYHTVKTHNITLNHLKAYEAKRRITLTFDSLTLAFHDDLINYFNAQGKALNSVGTQIKNIKAFAKEARRRKYKVHEDIDSFKKLSEDTDQVYLSMEELDTIWKLDLSNKPKLDRTRDAFLFDCYTGIRLADLRNLKTEYINGERLRIVTQKNRERVVIPLHPVVLEIMEKNGQNPPKLMSDQKFRDYIKELCEVAGIDEMVSTEKTYGGEKGPRVCPKYKLVSVHTGRRSFATNHYLAGFDTISIMMMTGHRTEKAFLRYIRVTPEQNADRVAEHGFYKLVNISKEVVIQEM
jgi:integrase